MLSPFVLLYILLVCIHSLTYHRTNCYCPQRKYGALPGYRLHAKTFVLLGYNFHLLFGSHCANALHSAGRRFKQTDVRSIVDSSLLPLLGSRKSGTTTSVRRAKGLGKSVDDRCCL